MKKELVTDAITSELTQSVFFQKPPTVHSNEATTERPNTRTGEQLLHPPTDRVTTRPPAPAHGRIPERSPLSPPVLPTPRSTARPHARTGRPALQEKTERYSFEIYPTQKDHIEEYLYLHKRKTKEKISASHFIRTAIDYYFKTLK